jgi:hypothetical protein
VPSFIPTSSHLLSVLFAVVLVDLYALLGHTVGLRYKFTLSSKNEEMLAYFNALSGEQRSEVLRNLHADKEEGEFIDNEITNEKFEASMEEVAKAELYDNIMKEQRKQDLKTKCGTGSVPSHSLASDLQITLSSRNERDLCATKIIIRKEEHGFDAITCKKTRDKLSSCSTQRFLQGI